jgi:hypothetical protein
VTFRAKVSYVFINGQKESDVEKVVVFLEGNKGIEQCASQ